MRKFLKNIATPLLYYSLLTFGIGTYFVSATTVGEHYVAHPKKDVFILGDDMLGAKSKYAGLVKALNAANPGDQITIIIRENNGGYISNEYYVRDAILETKAQVNTIVVGWASSAAISILFSGDYVRINKREPVGIAHLSTPRSPESIAYDIKYSRFYKVFMTAQEWDRMINGEDVLLRGGTVCLTARAYVVHDTANFCVIHQKRMNTY